MAIKEIPKELRSSLKTLGFKSKIFTDSSWVYSSKEHTRRTLWLEEAKMYLREKHSLIVEACLSNNDGWYMDVFENPMPTIDDRFSGIAVIYWTTYEDALESGLKRAVSYLRKDEN